MTSTRTVNTILRTLGLSAELVRGDGYHYFVGTDVPNQSHSEMVHRTSDFTAAEWVDMLLVAMAEYPKYETEAERLHALAAAARTTLAAKVSA